MSVAALAMTARLHAAVYDHLFPGDGLEAAGLLLCNRGACGGRQRLLAAEFVCLPHESILAQGAAVRVVAVRPAHDAGANRRCR